MTLKNEFDAETYQFLKVSLGYSDKDISEFHNGTRLYHDLGWFGDSAWDLLEDLEADGINFDGFEFSTFFPSEFFDHKSVFVRFIVALLPIRSWLDPKQNYAPFTLEMISALLKTKRW